MIRALEVMQNLENGKALPFSFMLDDEGARFQYLHKRESGSEERREITYVYRTENAPLIVTVDCTYIAKHEMLTMAMRLFAEKTLEKNIRQLRILDLDQPDIPGTMIRGWNGGCVYDQKTRKNTAKEHFPPQQFTMWDLDLADEKVFYEDLKGRASLVLLPVWFLYGEDGGLWFAPEWGGSWRLEASAQGGKPSAWFELPCLDFTMMQTEEIQLPAVTIGTYEGQIGDGCVALRRAIYDEVTPTYNGEKPQPWAGYHAIGGSIPEFTPEFMEREMDLAASMGLENFVMASMWYRPPEGLPSPFSLEELHEMGVMAQSKAQYEISSFWEFNGDLEDKPSRFPHGLKKFAEDVEKRGMIMGLWYDPRINILTESWKNKNDFLTPYFHNQPNDKIWDMGLIDLGMESGRKFTIEMLEYMVEKHGAKYLWHDLNTDPRVRYWDHTEEEGRKGLKELAYYNGLCQTYDEFLQKHPDVWIEWCGGGGSMINLSILRRCHSLFIADYNDISYTEGEEPNTDINRAYRGWLNWILPPNYFSNMLAIPGNIYEKYPGIGMHNFLSQMSGQFIFNKIVSKWNLQDRADATRAIALFKSIRPYLCKDYWGLFPMNEDRQGWDGWQYHDSRTNSGVLFFFKQRDCKHDEESFEMRWPEKPEGINFYSLEGEIAITADGNKFKATMPGMAALVRYDQVEASGENEQALFTTM
ncbi:MAG: alpha-galactosidase [Candidatus Sumerlaeia bacterium]